MVIKDFKLLFKRNASALFYYFEQFNMGAAYLMTNAHFKSPNVVDLVSKSDVKIHLKITKVLQSMPKSVSTEIISIFKYILSEYSSSSKNMKHPGFSTSLKILMKPDLSTLKESMLCSLIFLIQKQMTSVIIPMLTLIKLSNII